MSVQFQKNEMDGEGEDEKKSLRNTITDSLGKKEYLKVQIAK